MGYHYVPQFYLRGFESGSSIWAYDKARGTKFSTQVKSVANETGIYSDELEMHLAAHVEEPAKPAIVKARAKQRLTPDDRLALARYVVVLWKRVPKARERALARLPAVADEVRVDIHSRLSEIEGKHPELAAEVADWRKKVDVVVAAQLQKPSHEIWYRGIASLTGPHVIDALLSMTWTFLSSEQAQFLTGDNPVFFFEHEGIGQPTSELTVPLSSSLALWASRAHAPDGRYLAALPGGVREVNRRTAHNSSRFVFAARDEQWILPFVSKANWRLTRLQLGNA